LVKIEFSVKKYFQIRILRKDSTRGTAVYCDLKYPSALVVIEPGRYCAVLDHVGIRLYDYRRESFLNLVEHDSRKGFFNCRGKCKKF